MESKVAQSKQVISKRILVTGGTGFVGTYVCKLLSQRGYFPVAVALQPFSQEANFILGLFSENIEFSQADILNRHAMQKLVEDLKPDAIIHAAGYVGHDASLRDPAMAYDVNIGGTVNILEAARKAKVNKVILISSNAAYHKRQHDIFDETHPTTSISQGNPNAHYGASKMAAEQVGLAYFSFHDLDVVILRITSVYGFGMKPGQMVLKQIVEAAVDGEAIMIPTGGGVVRDYTYVEDTAVGILNVLDADTKFISKRIFNISRGELSSTFDIAEAVRRTIPMADVKIGNKMTSFEQATLEQRAPLSWNAAKANFNYDSVYSIDDGIRKYIEEYRRYKIMYENINA